jgi:hypothetical protein
LTAFFGATIVAHDKRKREDYPMFQNQELLERLTRKNATILGYTKNEGCAARFSSRAAYFQIIASWGGGWDHVSISLLLEKRCPTWAEMCMIKELFFKDEECVIQYHPAKANYVNEFVLHLWRPQNVEIPMPPKDYV